MSTRQLPPDGDKSDGFVDAVDAALRRERRSGSDPDAGSGFDPVLRETGDGGGPPATRSPGRRRAIWLIAAAVVVLASAGAFVYVSRPVYVLDVRSAPEGAEVRLDGVPMGRAPLMLTLSEMPRRIRLQLEGHEAVEEPLSFAPDDRARVDVTLARLVQVESDPPGARIVIDEIDTGLTTPAAVPIKEPYPSYVQLRLDGFAVAELPVTGDVVREGRLRTALERAAGSALDARTVVTVSGTYAFAVSGCGTESAEANWHTLNLRPPCTLRLLAPAYLLDATRAVEPSTARRVDLAAPSLVSVQLRSRYETCALSVNGRAFGTPPADVIVAEGRYSATLECPDGRKLQTKMFEIAVGQSVRRVDDFLP
jgi:hypothetical protein